MFNWQNARFLRVKFQVTVFKSIEHNWDKLMYKFNLYNYSNIISIQSIKEGFLIFVFNEIYYPLDIYVENPWAQN